MNIEADALRYDDLKQTSVFTGKVVVTKGTIVIRGARVECGRTPRATSTAWSRPSRASWRSTGKSAKAWTSSSRARREVIEYDGQADRVKFISAPRCGAIAAPR